MLALFYMTLKLVFPLIVSGYQCSVRLLHIDEHGVVDGIFVETAHGGEVLRIPVGLEQVFDALLNPLGDFPQSLFIAGGILSH